MIGLLLVFGVAGATCEHSAQDRVVSICETFCHCMSPPTDLAQEQCNTTCIGDASGAGVQITDACTSCITAHADRCGTVMQDCEQICNFNTNPPPPPPVDFPDGGVLVDSMTTVDAF